MTDPLTLKDLKEVLAELHKARPLYTGSRLEHITAKITRLEALYHSLKEAAQVRPLGPLPVLPIPRFGCDYEHTLMRRAAQVALEAGSAESCNVLRAIAGRDWCVLEAVAEPKQL